MPSITVKGVRYLSDGCSPERYFDQNGNEAPPEGYDLVTQRWLRRSGRKLAGRHRLAAGDSIHELRLVAHENGASEEELARREGIDIESIKHSLRRARREREQSGQ